MTSAKVFGEWEVTTEGLVNRSRGIAISRSELVEEREPGISEWALHFAEKEWCAMEEFIPALQVALSTAPNSIDWKRTSVELRDMAYDMIIDQEVARRSQTEQSWQLSDLDMLEDEEELLKRVGWRPTRR